MVSWKFWCSANQLKEIENFLKRKSYEGGLVKNPSSRISYARLNGKVQNKVKENRKTYWTGVVLIVLLAAVAASCEYFLVSEQLENLDETEFNHTLLMFIIAEVVVTLIVLYALSLLIASISILRANAVKTGNDEGLRHVCKILIITVLLLIETIINQSSAVILASLRYK